MTHSSIIPTLTDPEHVALRIVVADLVEQQRAYEEARVQALLTEAA